MGIVFTVSSHPEVKWKCQVVSTEFIHNNMYKLFPQRTIKSSNPLSVAPVVRVVCWDLETVV